MTSSRRPVVIKWAHAGEQVPAAHGLDRCRAVLAQIGAVRGDQTTHPRIIEIHGNAPSAAAPGEPQTAISPAAQERIGHARLDRLVVPLVLFAGPRVPDPAQLVPGIR
ncbi:MAG: hypothetical protein ACYCX9_12520 [Candidatus Dormibacteria bacterium]